MFENLEEIISIVLTSVAAVSALIGFIVSSVKNLKNKELAKRAEITNEVADLAKEKVIEIEKMYGQASQMLKAMGFSTGEIKKENVINYIKSQCSDKGIKFDSEYWSEQVEGFIRVMNVNKK